MVSSEGMIHTRKRLIAYVCPGYGATSTTPHAHDARASTEMDQKREGDRLLEGGHLLRPAQR
jgi:hypothetical protein